MRRKAQRIFLRQANPTGSIDSSSKAAARCGCGSKAKSYTQVSVLRFHIPLEGYCIPFLEPQPLRMDEILHPFETMRKPLFVGIDRGIIILGTDPSKAFCRPLPPKPPGHAATSSAASEKSPRAARPAALGVAALGARPRRCHAENPIERLYKPPMNPYVVSSCLRASLRFPYATHVLAYAAVKQHVKLTHRLRVGVLSVSPQELLTRASFPVQPPELLKMMWMTVWKR